MSSRLKKKYAKPDELENVVTAKDYYAEFKKTVKSLSDGEAIPFFYIPEFSFKPDPKAKGEEDGDPLLWIGEYPSAWEKILKPKVKYATGSLKAAADSEGEEQDDKKLTLTLEDGNGAKPIIAKKIARYVKQTAKVKVLFDFPEGEEGSETLVEEAKEISSSTTSPFTRIIQIFKEYQTATLTQKIPYLVKLNTLFEEWNTYDSALKADVQSEKIEQIKTHLDGKINELITQINEAVKTKKETFVQRADSGLRATNPDVPKISDLFVKMIMESEKIKAQAHHLISIVDNTSGVSNWFSKKMGNLGKLKDALKLHDQHIAQKVVEIKAWLNRQGVDSNVSVIDERALNIVLPTGVKIPSKITEALAKYNTILNNGEAIADRAKGLQTESMLLLEQLSKLKPSENPWVEQLKTQIWDAKDELGIYLYDNDNYQKVQDLYDKFIPNKNVFDKLSEKKKTAQDKAKAEIAKQLKDGTITKQQAKAKEEDIDNQEDIKRIVDEQKAMRKDFLNIIEDLGIEISEWEAENLEFSNFEVKEKSKHIENIRRIITDFLQQLLQITTNTGLKTDMNEMLNTAALMSFSHLQPYDGKIRKLVADSNALFSEVTALYLQKVSTRALIKRKEFTQSSVEDVLQKCNQIKENIDMWVVKSQRCDLEKGKVAYEEDQNTINLIAPKTTQLQANTRDIVNLILSFNANEDVVVKLRKEIDNTKDGLKKKLNDAKTALNNATNDADKSKAIMQIAKLRSDLIQKEEQLHAATNLLLEPFKRLKTNVAGVENSLPQDMKEELKTLEDRHVKDEIQNILDNRLSDHALRYRNIVARFETYQTAKTSKTLDEKKQECRLILQDIYVAEQSITAEDSFKEKLLEENPSYASLLPEDLKTSFAEKLQTYKFMRMNIDDELQSLLDTSSKPLRDEMYDAINSTCTTNKTATNVDVLYAAKTKVNKLYNNWVSLNSIKTTDNRGEQKLINTGDFETKKVTLETAIKALNDQLEKVGKEQDFFLTSFEKIQEPAFEQAMKTTLAKLLEIEKAVNVTDFQQKLEFYQSGLRNSVGTPDEKMYKKLVKISQTKLDLANKSKVHAGEFSTKYKTLLATPTTFAKETDPVGKLLGIKDEIETELKRLMKENLDALKVLEGQFFAAFGSDFDFYRSTKGGKNDILSSEKNEVMSLMGIDIINRFNALESTGATKEELRKTLEHIPVSMWPDEVLETLQAWEKVTAMTKANLQERTEQLTQENEDMAKAFMNEKDSVLENINALIGLNSDVKAFKEKAEGFVGKFFEGMENAEKLQTVVLNLMGDPNNGLVQKYNSKPERLCQILVAIKNSKEVVESLMGKEKEKEKEDDKKEKSFVDKTIELVDTVSGKKKEEEEEEEEKDKEKSVLDKISSTVDSVIESMEAFMEKFFKDDADAFDKTLAVVSLAQKTGKTITELIDDEHVANQYIDLVGTGLGAIGDIKDALTNEDMSKKDKMVKMLTIAGSITGALSKKGKDGEVGGLLDGTEAGKVLEVVTNVIKAVDIANNRLNALIGKEKLSREEIEDRLSRTPDVMRKIKEDVLGPMGKAVDIIGDVNTVMQMFGAAVDLAPGLSIASNVLGLAQMILDLAKTVEERKGHVALHTDTILYSDDDALSLSMRQNVKNDNMKIAQQSVDAFAQVISTAGSIAEVAGPASPAGMALKYTGTAIKIGAKVIFAAIDEAKVLHVKNLIKEALAGKREAKLEIFRDSAYYAKMYIIGLAQDGANGNKNAESLAKEFCLGYGISDDTLKTETAEMILRKIFQSTDEHDDRYSKIGGGIKSLIEMIKKKWNKLSGDDLLNALLEELNSDLQVLDTRMEELHEALEGVDELVKQNQITTIKNGLFDLRAGLIKERTKLQKLEVAGTAKPEEVAKIGKIQKLVDVLGKHGI